MVRAMNVQLIEKVGSPLVVVVDDIVVVVVVLDAFPALIQQKWLMVRLNHYLVQIDQYPHPAARGAEE